MPLMPAAIWPSISFSKRCAHRAAVAEWRNKRRISAAKHQQLNVHRSFEDEICWAGQRDVREPAAIAFEADLISSPPRTSTLIGPSSSLRRGKDQRARDHAGAARERLVFDSALVGADRDRVRAALLEEIYVRAARRESLVMPQRGRRARRTLTSAIRGPARPVRHAAIDIIAANMRAEHEDLHVRLEIFRITHLQRDVFAFSVAAMTPAGVSNETFSRAPATRSA